MVAASDGRRRDWTALPGELLASIRGRLPPADFARFAAVCTTWRRPGPSTPAPQLPWLMLPPSSYSSPGEAATCRFFSPSEGRTYVVPVPELQGTRCVGFCEGWVASFDGTTAELSLVNPLTRARIPLPSSLAAIPEVTAARGEEGLIVQYGSSGDEDGRGVHYMIHDVHGIVKNVVMSSEPAHPACRLAAILGYFLPTLSIAVGAPKWGVLEGADELLDVVYHGGDGRFYGLNSDNRVLRWDADNAAVVEHCRAAPEFPGHGDRYERHLAVHRPSGDLLLVFVDLQGIPMPKLRNVVRGRAYRTEAVTAFRYKGGDGGSAGAWLRLESLGGCTLFLGWNGNQYICLSAQDATHLWADCIFLIGQDFECGDMGLRCTYGLWVYDLKRGILEPFCPDWRNWDEAPLWFVPKLS